MNRYFPAIAVLALALFPAAALAQGAEPMNKPSPSDNIANDLNAKSLQKVQQEQEQMKKEVERKNEEAMRKWREQNEERYRQWKKEHPETP